MSAPPAVPHRTKQIKVSEVIATLTEALSSGVTAS